MSKLSDLIRKATRPTHQPFGFTKSSARTAEKTLLVVASLSSADAGKAAEAFEKGADTVIVDAAPKKAGDGGPVGVSIQGAGREQVAALREAGVDFVVLDSTSTPAEALLEESIGFVLRLDEDAEDTTLRLIGEMGFDAVIVPAPADPLTLAELIGLRRVATLTRLPIMTTARADASASRLQALRDSGVCCAIVDGSELGKVGKLQETIAGLPARGRKREEKGDGAIPTGVGAPGHSHGDDDYDDDDD